MASGNHVYSPPRLSLIHVMEDALPSILRAYICLALKSVPRATRQALADKDWQVREAAEHQVADAIEKALTAFEFATKPMIMSTAPSQREETG
jgi:hypothetical protein